MDIDEILLDLKKDILADQQNKYNLLTNQSKYIAESNNKKINKQNSNEHRVFEINPNLKSNQIDSISNKLENVSKKQTNLEENMNNIIELVKQTTENQAKIKTYIEEGINLLKDEIVDEIRKELNKSLICVNLIIIITYLFFRLKYKII